jgi:sugar (pentulose or hexulose) kinase
VQWLRENHGDVIKAQSLNTPTTIWTLPQFLWLQENEPEVWAQTEHILFAKDYLRYRLTGSMETDTIDAAGSMFFDVTTQAWSEDLCRIGNIPMNWLPALRDPADEAGIVTEAAAQEFGLAPGTKVFVGTTDTVMEVLAAGSVAPGHTTVKLATAGRICVITDARLDSPFIFNYRHVVPGLWYPGTGTASCANSYRWYRDTLGRDDYEAMNEAAAKIPADVTCILGHLDCSLSQFLILVGEVSIQEIFSPTYCKAVHLKRCDGCFQFLQIISCDMFRIVEFQVCNPIHLFVCFDGVIHVLSFKDKGVKSSGVIHK